MKRRTIALAVALAAAAAATYGQTSKTDIAVSNVTKQHVAASEQVAMDIDLTAVKVRKNRALILTPTLTAGADSAALRSIGIYGRRRYYQYLRKNGTVALTGDDEIVYKARKKPTAVAYDASTAYEAWMKGSDVVVVRTLYGCCQQKVSEASTLAKAFVPFVPTYHFLTPPAAIKSREVEGLAHIDFPVDKTYLAPTYRNNPAELATIAATIDSLAGDGDITITAITLAGYASPEGSYKHNNDLAIGRVTTLRSYLIDHYGIDGTLIDTLAIPEDWGGLRDSVVASTLPHKAAILAIIDSDDDPDVKDSTLRQQYPGDYHHLLNVVYPALRHTDYRIRYTVRAYHDIDEIRAIYASTPDKLGLNELYLLAGSYETGSTEFNDVFATASALFPDDEIAHINAATAALQQGDVAAAKDHIAKGGDSAAATYVRALLAVEDEDYAAASALFAEAAAAGIADAEDHKAFLDEHYQ